MNIDALKTAINHGKYVSLKVTYCYLRNEVILEATDAKGDLIHLYKRKFNEGGDDISLLQIKMINLAAEYKNKGFYPIINPFTN